VAHDSEISTFHFPTLLDRTYINTRPGPRRFISPSCLLPPELDPPLEIPSFQRRLPKMRAFLGLFLAGLISTVSASYALYPRQVPGYPACAQGCLANATSNECQPGEVHCLCLDPNFINSTTACFESSCSGTDLQAADQAAVQNCELAGVTLAISTPTSSAAPTSNTGASKQNGADSTMVNIMGGAAALGLAVLAL